MSRRVAYARSVSRTTTVLVLANLVVVAVWIVLRVAWFDGAVGCDDEGTPATDTCYRRMDAIAYLSWAAVAFLAVSVLVVAARRLRR